jgi:hypothetical protein
VVAAVDDARSWDQDPRIQTTAW